MLFIPFNAFHKPVEEEVGVVGAAAGFGVELDAEGGDVGVGDAFYGAVVHVEKAHFGVCWE